MYLFLIGKNVVIVVDSILINKDVFEPSYNYLKFTVWNFSCFCTNLTIVRLVKAMVFPVVMYGCESWTVKKAERRKLMLLKCGVGEDSWESLGLQGDPTSPS